MARVTIADSVRLDVRRLARLERLRPGTIFPWTWPGRQYPAVDLRPLPDAEDPGRSRAVEVRWRLRDGSGRRQELMIRWAPLSFGGVRPWWACPDCSRRVALVYYWGQKWAYRTCQGLDYPSQHETPEDRAWRRMGKLRIRLGAEPGCGIILPEERPRGMHWTTFERLSEQAALAEREWFRLVFSQIRM